jgi:hypothetical protein
LVVCDSTYQSSDGKLALVGLFNRVSAARFPATHPKMAIYVSLTDARPGTRCKLDIVHAETDKPIIEAEGPLPGEAEPTTIIDLNFELNGVTFPEPGRYYVRFFANGYPLLMRPFDVTKTGETSRQ